MWTLLIVYWQIAQCEDPGREHVPELLNADLRDVFRVFPIARSASLQKDADG